MKRALSALLALITILGLAWVAIPVVLIRPFGPQTPRGLALSYALRERSPLLTILLLGAGIAAAIALWRRLRWKGRSLTTIALALLGATAFLARQNHFEWMFRPLPRPEFADAAQAKDVADDDLVLGVEASGDDGGAVARAYPVLAMAYHHVVNDVVATEPIVATY